MEYTGLCRLLGKELLARGQTRLEAGFTQFLAHKYTHHSKKKSQGRSRGSERESFQHPCIIQTLVRDVWRPMAKRRECLDALSRAAVVSDELGGEQCPVCLEEGPTRVTVACGHAFHSHCLVRCLEESTNCPMCRTDMLLSSEIT